MTQSKPEYFSICLELKVALSAQEIWPDGNVPENPTSDDVASKIMRCGGAAAIIKDWHLDTYLEGFVMGPDGVRSSVE